MELEPTAIRRHLSRITASPEFAGVPRLQRFLTFVVETSLSGRASEIKETLVAVEVYGRSTGYSPQQDATVRVEAGRLRARLKQYYEGSGQHEAIEITLPRGTYAPSFQPRTLPAQPTPAPSMPRRLSISAAAALAALTLTGGWALWAARSTSIRAKAEATPEALELFFRGRQLLKQPRYVLSLDGSTPPSVLQAVQLFEEAVRRSPQFAPGWASLAEANEFAWELDTTRPASRLAAARTAARKAVQLDPNLPDAWNILASLHFYRDFDLAAAESACRRAIHLNPRDTLAHRRYLDLLRIQGRTEEGLAHATRAMSLNPIAVTLRLRRAMLLYDAGRFHEAVQDAVGATALNPTGQQPLHSMELWIQGASHQQMGRFHQAEQLYRAALIHEPNDTWNGPALGYLLAITGRRAEAESIAEALATRMREGKSLHSQLALVYAGLGRDAEAIQLLEDGFRRRDPGVLFAPIDKRFERLRSNSRFLAFLNVVNGTVENRRQPINPAALLAPL